MPTDFSSQISNWINAIQYRSLPGTNAQVVAYNAQMNAGASQPQIIGSIEADSYTANFVNVVLREYQAAFGRVPDQSGAGFWVNQFASGSQSLNSIADVFANSAEFNSLYHASANTPTSLPLVTALYTNVLGRAPDAAGLNFWASQPLTAGQLLTQFAQSQEFINAMAPRLIGFQNLEISGNAPTSGSFFQVPTAPTFTLTTNLETVHGSGSGGDIINAPLVGNQATLQAGDVIAETGTGNVLNISFNGNSVSGASISGVQTINATNSNAANFSNLTGLITGVSSFNNVGSSGMVMIGQGAGLGTLLNSIGVNNSSATTAAFFATSALAGANDSLTINATDAGNPLASAQVWATDVTSTNANGFENFTINASGTNFISLRGQAGLNNTNSVSVLGTGAVTVTGDGFVGRFANITTIDASQASGPVNITGSLTNGLLSLDTKVQSVRTGSGDDRVDLSSMSLANLTANNTLVDLGGGTNTLVVNAAVATTNTALSNISNVQIL